jgi:hypothetical protein
MPFTTVFLIISQEGHLALMAAAGGVLLLVSGSSETERLVSKKKA